VSEERGVPLQNRVTPLGDLVAEPGRGLVYGNRGCLHDAEGKIRRRFAGRRWIACRLTFRGWQRAPLLQPGRFTELFFLDEATAFAAGHRPCALCRRDDYRAFASRWLDLHPHQHGADAMDKQLHAERIGAVKSGRLLHRLPYTELPDGAFVMHDDLPQLVHGNALYRWSTSGYSAPSRRPEAGDAVVITPPSLLAALAAGWEGAVPLFHPSLSERAGSAAGAASS
jgi:hypothetical protein